MTKLKLIRLINGMTLKELASRMGVSCSTIRRLEYSRVHINSAQADAICTIFKIPLSELFEPVRYEVIKIKDIEEINKLREYRRKNHQ